MTFEQLKQSITKKQFAALYLLSGEESYFLDKLAESLDEHVLEKEAHDFNREVFYGAQATVSQLLNACKGFPVMADKRFVMLKEAQDLKKDNWEKLLPYLSKPSPSTVFVLVFKGKTSSVPKKVLDACNKNGTTFDAKKMYDKDVRAWATLHITQAGFEAEQGVVDTVIDFLGTNFFMIENELDKIFILLSGRKEKKISKQLVFEMMNIDREFNVFELTAALGKKDSMKAHLIIHKLSQNPKNNPAILIISNLFRFFNDLSMVYAHKLTDARSIQEKMKLNFYAAQDMSLARQKYNLGSVYRNISFILEADLMLKGQIQTSMDEAQILKNLVWKLLN